MSRLTAREVERLRDRPTMFTPTGSFGEVSAYLVGRAGPRAEVRPFPDSEDWLDGFQQWLGARRDGRPELAFWTQVLAELGIEGNVVLCHEDDERARLLLAEWLLDYLTDPA